MKIQVTEEDIKNGCQLSDWNCPIAIAINRAYGFDPSELRVCVDGSDKIWVAKIRDEDGEDYDTYDTTSEILSFIGAFDLGQPVRPREFELKRSYCDI